MGKSLKGKELGVGITQRKDGIYQARFTDRFGKRKTIYDKKLGELRRKLRESQYQDDRELNTVTEDMTLDEWFDIWLNTCKKNCRDTTIVWYIAKYNRIKSELGWRRLSQLNFITMQRALNGLSNDTKRKDCKILLVDMLDKAVYADLLVKNTARRLNTVVTRERKKERRVLTIKETKTFMDAAKGTSYYDLYVLALETGMRIGEICGLQWEDVDLNEKKLQVKRTLCYFQKDGKYIFQFHDTKTISGYRMIPLTTRAVQALRRQRAHKNKIVLKGKQSPDGYENLVFITRDNQPIESRTVQKSMEYIMKNIRKKQDFERFTPHTFRHTFATRAIEQGMNPKTLQKILGHATLQMTMDLYCHVTDDTLSSEMQKLEMPY